MKIKGLVIFILVLWTATLFAQDMSKRGAYTMPYLRYDSQEAIVSGRATHEKTKTFDVRTSAAEASNQEFWKLNENESSIAWKVIQAANGIVVRFTMPDDKTGEGTTGELDVLINGKKVESLPLTSRWAYQYFERGTPQKQPDEKRLPLFQFDEIRFLLKQSLIPGDEIKLVKKSGTYIGVDFIELEAVEAPIKKPNDALSVTEFGAKANDGKDDLNAFVTCMKAAYKQNKSVYIPEGEFTLSNRLELTFPGTTMMGSGMWYTKLYFSNDAPRGGGIASTTRDVHVSHFFMDCNNTTRMDNGRNRGYHCFSGSWRGQSVIEYVWEQHFTVGIWTSSTANGPTDGLRVSHVRLRNNYADGVNFASGSSNCIFEYSDVRNCGDDGLASWSSNGLTNNTCNKNNIFRWNTVEFIWRASGIGMFGGGGHKIYNNIVSECLGSSALRFVSDFPGCGYDPNNPMEVYNCTFYKCGSRQTLYGAIYGAIELHGSRYEVWNMKIHDIDIIESQVDAIRMIGKNVSGIEFKNIHIKGTGKDDWTMKVPGNDNYRGAGVYCETEEQGSPECSATFKNVTFEDCYDGNYYNVNKTYKLTIKK